MKKELTREQMILLIASDYGFSQDITNKLKTEILKEVCNSSQPFAYLSNLLKFGKADIYLDN